MSLKLGDRVRDTTATSGISDFVLANAAPSTYQTFGSALSNGDTCYYCCAEQSGVNWESGLGTYSTTGPTLARTTIYAGSNGTTAVSFAAGTKDIFLGMPSSCVPPTIPQAVCEGRLSLVSGDPVNAAGTASASTVYFSPYLGNRISLYDGTRWKMYSFTERSIALSGLTASLPYDVWIYDNAGTLTLEILAWSTTTARATALVLQDGVWCKTGALTRRYLGTFAARRAGRRPATALSA